MELKKLIVDTKEAWVDFPGISGFSVLVVNLSRKELLALRKRCTSQKFDRKTRAVVDVLDEERFVKEFTNATLKGWKGLKMKDLEMLLPVDVSEEDPEKELPFSVENAEVLVSSSVEFDTWLNEVVFDLENFRSR